MADLTPEQAEAVRRKFYSNPHWDKLNYIDKQGVGAALEALPDETLMRRRHWIWREMFKDIKRMAQKGTSDGDV
jgi:hypothetical protein